MIEKLILGLQLILLGAFYCHASTPSEDLLIRLKRTTERDPYVFNLFEVILTTLESKLRRVENMDKALEHLVRRLDMMEGQLSLTLNTTTKIVHLLDVRLDSGGCLKPAETPPSPASLKQVTRVVRHRPYTGYFESLSESKKPTVNAVVRGFTSPSTSSSNSASRTSSIRRLNGNRNSYSFSPAKESTSVSGPNVDTGIPGTIIGTINGGADGKMEAQLDEVAKRVVLIDTKISNLQEQLDTNTITRQTEELIASASESYRVGISLGDRLQAVEKKSDLGLLEASVEDMRSSLESVDRRLQIHVDYSGKSFVEISNGVTSLKRIIEDILLREKSNPWCVSSNINKGLNKPSNKTSDACTSPFEEIKKKSDQIIQSMLSVKDLEILGMQALKEQQTLHTKEIQDVRKEMSDKTSLLLKNIDEVKQNLRKIRLSERDALRNSNINPIAFLQQATGAKGNQLSVTQASTPPSDILDQRVLEENNVSSSNETKSDRSRSASVIFPQKHKKPVESAFLSSIDSEIQGYSCLELLNKGQKKSGIYHLKIRGTTYWFLQVYCDMTTAGGGWTVLQRRDDFGEPRESFSRSWAEYKHGFGSPEKELWLGNENIYMLTNTDDYLLRVDMEDFDGNKRYAEYTTFKLHGEKDMYKLEIGGYNGTAGDALNDPWYGSNLSPFSTYDTDNDRSSLNCAAMLKGGWWWRSCGRGLNGLYLSNPNDFTARQGIVWFRWRGWDYTLKRTVLMIRPKMLDEDEGIS